MTRTALWSAALLATTLTFVPTAPSFARSLQKDVDQSAVIIQRFRNMPEQGIPDAVLRDAKGLAILTRLKAGFVFSGEGGAGVVIARTPRGWSAPSAIGTGGVGFGFQIGAEVAEI